MARTTRTTTTSPTTAQQLGSIIKACRDIMRKDKGLSGDLDRLPMLTWVLFLKFLDDMERVREDEAQLSGERFVAAIEPPYRWRDWAIRDNALTGKKLLNFINNDEYVFPRDDSADGAATDSADSANADDDVDTDDTKGVKGPGLFAYLRSLSGGQNEKTRDRRDVIATVFEGVTNRMQSGFLLREVIEKVNGIHFTSSEELHTLGALYESMLQEMRDAAGDSGEFYTPRAVVRFMVSVTNPRLGEVTLDPACGTGGFLVETFKHLRDQCKTVEDQRRLQDGSLLGVEAKPLPYLLAQMNLVLHGLESPQIDPGNALRHKLGDMGDSQRVDVILTNPPFGGEEERGIQNNFPDGKRTGETALLFLQLIMRKLRRPVGSHKPGRAAVVVPNGTLFGDGVAARIKEDMLREFNLHTVVRLPNGVFAPYTSIPTNILFFDRSGPTQEVWYYEQPLPEGRKQYTKTAPMRYEEFADLVAWWGAPEGREENERAWRVPAQDILANGCNLDIKNPNAKQDITHLPPEELVASILDKERRIAEVLVDIQRLLAEGAR